MSLSPAAPRRVTLLLVFALVFVALPVTPVMANEIAPETVSDVVDDLEVNPNNTERGIVESAVKESSFPFNSIGVKADGNPTVSFRTKSTDGAWLAWETLEPLDELDGPDDGTEEAEDAAAATPDAGWVSDAIWVGDSTHIQLRVKNGDLDDVDVHTIDSMGLSETLWQRASRTAKSVFTPASAEAASYPGIVTRSQWGANESMRRGGASYASSVRFAVVHHTAGSNSYTRAEAPGVVRGIYSWHVNGNGWKDIGYNILVDRYGTVYEGRYGGVDRAVIGAHAANYNTGSFGITVMGHFDKAQVPAAAFDAVRDVMAWKYRVHGINADPSARVSVNGRSIPTLVGHKDVGNTSCPGKYFASRLGELRNGIASKAGGLYSDVPAGSTFENDIARITKAGITKGCGTGRYCPGDAVTRDEMASFLARAKKLSSSSRAQFRDVPSSQTHFANINAIAQAGITNGCNPPSNDKYCPERKVSRAEMATFIARAKGLKPRSGSEFLDVASGNTHSGNINALAAAGITKGCNPPKNDRFCPDDAVTRDEMAAFLSRAFLK